MLVVAECGCDRWRREGRRSDQSDLRAYLAAVTVLAVPNVGDPAASIWRLRAMCALR